MSHETTAAAGASPAPVKHTLYVPGYRLAKLGLAILGLVLIALSFDKFGPLLKMAMTGGAAKAEVEQIVRIDGSNQAMVFTSDGDIQAAVKKGEETRDHESVWYVDYRFTTSDGKVMEKVRSPLGQHVKPLQPLKDSDGLPSTARIWYDRDNPMRIAMPLMFGTWFMPGMLALFGVLGTFMGLMLWWYANKPIEMPDLSRSHGEKDSN